MLNGFGWELAAPAPPREKKEKLVTKTANGLSYKMLHNKREGGRENQNGKSQEQKSMESLDHFATDSHCKRCTECAT